MDEVPIMICAGVAAVLMTCLSVRCAQVFDKKVQLYFLVLDLGMVLLNSGWALVSMILYGVMRSVGWAIVIIYVVKTNRWRPAE